MEEGLKENRLKEEYPGQQLYGSLSSPQKRLLIGVPVTGLLRVEWVLARYGQVIPCNWAQVEAYKPMNNQASPLNFLVADARNLVVKDFLEGNYEWLFFIDHDTILPARCFIRWNERMIKGDVPVFSGLYFTRSCPAEPILYRGRGNGYYADWTMGDEVWVDGIPMGCAMIHHTILRAIWEESPEYAARSGVHTYITRRVFENPQEAATDPEARINFALTGTEDLKFCAKLLEQNIFEKAGWPEYAQREFPFLVDTNVFCRHIEPSGIQYPSAGEEREFEKPLKLRRVALVNEYADKKRAN